jgi:hypothetical protein
MDFIIGGITSLAVAYVVARIAMRQEAFLQFDFPRYTQSYNYQLLSPLIRDAEPHIDHYDPIKTQATDYFDSKHTRVVILDDYAYWINNNKLWCAELNLDGVDENSTKEVDIMGMNKVELNKMIMVVDKLTEGKQNDGGSPGNKKF